MNRTSSTQLKALLDHLDAATTVDHPLVGMFRGMIRDALLDLRDARAAVAVASWAEGRISANKQQLINLICDVGRSDVGRSQDDLRRELVGLADFMLAPPDTEHLRAKAMAPLTGKEK